MKRDRFQRDVIDRCSRFSEWARWVTGERVSEAPYELLRAWRRTFGVAPNVPHQSTRIVRQPGACAHQMGFHLEDAHHVLLFACVDMESGLPVVHMYGPEDGTPHVYDDWRDQRAWPWPQPLREATPDFSALLPDVWLHFGQTARTYIGPYDVIKLASAPLSKGWLAMWRHERMDSLWKDIAGSLGPFVSSRLLVCAQALGAICSRLRQRLRRIGDVKNNEIIAAYARLLCVKCFPDAPNPTMTFDSGEKGKRTVTCAADADRIVYTRISRRGWCFFIWRDNTEAHVCLDNTRAFFNFLSK
jgi:hypothetical protein